MLVFYASLQGQRIGDMAKIRAVSGHVELAAHAQIARDEVHIAPRLYCPRFRQKRLPWCWGFLALGFALRERGERTIFYELQVRDVGRVLQRAFVALHDGDECGEQEVKSKRLIEMDTANFEEDWDRASAAMERALERVTSTAAEGFGVFNRRWLPYKTILPVLAAITETLRESNAGADAYAALRRWYWTSVFLGRYTGATETVAYADFLDIMRHVRGEKEEPNVFAEARSQIVQNAGFSLRGTSRVSAADYKGVMKLIALGGAKDFANNDGITFQELDDHHIFPQAFLKNERGTTGDGANTIVNRTLIAGVTNRKISKKKPSDYLHSIIPDDHREAILDSHLVDAEARAAMEEDDYEAFLAAREEALIFEIRQLVS